MSELTLGSLFDGSGGFPLGGVLAGITPLWSSEIEPFAVRVTTKRLPQMEHYGDVSSLNGAELPPVDIITFGSQDNQGNEVCNKWQLPAILRVGERSRSIQLKWRRGLSVRPRKPVQN